MNFHSKTITSWEMRGINRTAILELIRREGPISRTEIARKLQVSVPTVLRILEDLAEERLVRLSGQKERSGGRRRELVQLNSSEHLTIGIDLGGTKFYGAVADLSGKILADHYIYSHSAQGEEAYGILIELIRVLLERIQPPPAGHIRGIGVGAPGITSLDGVVENAPSLGWVDFPLRERLLNDFGLPTIVDNDVNLAALGELWFGEGQNVENFVLINIGTGIGAGIVLGGSLYRGTHCCAGEIGYMMPGREYLKEEYPGFGALEYLAAGFGIAQQAKKSLSRNDPHIDGEPITAEDVFEAYRRGESWTVEIVQSTMDYLAIAIIGITAIFDPSMVILGGGVSRSADILLPGLVERMRGRVPFVPKLTVSSLGLHAAALGAVAELLYRSSDYYLVHKLD